MNNITDNIRSKIGRRLHLQKNHPLEIVKSKIYNYFGSEFIVFDDLSEIVSVKNNFDLLLIPEDHPSRKMTDSYYENESTVLRTHTSAHQVELMSRGITKFLVTGPCYRRDEIDSTHYPIFHQMEGIKILPRSTAETEKDLLNTLTGLVKHLFPGADSRITESYFPFTNPSYEIEICWNNKWIEVLGCGVIHPDVMENANQGGKVGWAFGMGLERLAMILFNIPDIRLFWTSDERFHEQFKHGQIVEFKPYSKYPSCYKDISFWIDQNYHYNDFCELVRETGQDLVEDVQLIDKFQHPKTGLVSHCYRINYRSNDRSLTNEEINARFANLHTLIAQRLNIVVRK